jgi:hypothetical protein
MRPLRARAEYGRWRSFCSLLHNYSAGHVTEPQVYRGRAGKVIRDIDTEARSSAAHLNPPVIELPASHTKIGSAPQTVTGLFAPHGDGVVGAAHGHRTRAAHDNGVARA